MKKPRDPKVAKAVDRLFRQFQSELEIESLKFRLAALERRCGYQDIECASVLAALVDALERQGRASEAYELLEHSGRVVLASIEPSDDETEGADIVPAPQLIQLTA